MLDYKYTTNYFTFSIPIPIYALSRLSNTLTYPLHYDHTMYYSLIVPRSYVYACTLPIATWCSFQHSFQSVSKSSIVSMLITKFVTLFAS